MIVWTHCEDYVMTCIFQGTLHFRQEFIHDNYQFSCQTGSISPADTCVLKDPANGKSHSVTF
ncbi:MAG TPA: hypothetical protein DDZ90_14070 [Planctomycetaceae bacterium]|nr:hypothetical protein [Planctomycetaceae bacterium]